MPNAEGAAEAAFPPPKTDVGADAGAEGVTAPEAALLASGVWDPELEVPKLKPVEPNTDGVLLALPPLLNAPNPKPLPDCAGAPKAGAGVEVDPKAEG